MTKGDAVKVDDGVDRATVVERLNDALPAGLEAVDRTVTIEETQDDFGQISTIFGNVLLAFAIVTLVVSAFLINNTFQIVIGQRVRELALLRAIGATGKQVSRSVLFESFVVGAEHGFNNDTTPRFNKAAADLAWARTLALFKRTLA